MFRYIALGFSILFLNACDSFSENNPTNSSERTIQTISEKDTSICSESYLDSAGNLSDTLSDTSHIGFSRGFLKDTSEGSIIPHAYLDSTGVPYMCPFGGHPAPYKWTWRTTGSSCAGDFPKTLEYACPVYGIVLSIKF
jgi:hypothetical protein